jgi:hypothetical protein
MVMLTVEEICRTISTGLLYKCNFQVASQSRSEGPRSKPQGIRVELSDKPVCRVKMQRRLTTIRVPLLIIVFLLALGLPASSYCFSSAGVDFPSPDLSLENPQQENTLINHGYELRISRANDGFDVLLLIDNLAKQPSLIGLPKPSLDQETITLRC